MTYDEALAFLKQEYKTGKIDRKTYFIKVSGVRAHRAKKEADNNPPVKKEPSLLDIFDGKLPL